MAQSSTYTRFPATIHINAQARWSPPNIRLIFHVKVLQLLSLSNRSLAYPRSYEPSSRSSVLSTSRLELSNSNLKLNSSTFTKHGTLPALLSVNSESRKVALPAIHSVLLAGDSHTKRYRLHPSTNKSRSRFLLLKTPNTIPLGHHYTWVRPMDVSGHHGEYKAFSCNLRFLESHHSDTLFQNEDKVLARVSESGGAGFRFGGG